MSSNLFLFAPFRNALPVEIEKSYFEALQNSREVIFKLLELEECFDLFARSYLRLEQTLFEITQKFLFSRDAPNNVEELFGDARERLNLELISFLTASAVLIEKGDRLAKNAVVPGFDEDRFEPFRTELFDDNFEYRVMCGLRNFALHNKLPLGGISLDKKLEFENEALAPASLSRIRLSCNPTFQTRDLVSDKSLRAGTRKEIEQLGIEGLDIKYFVRRFVELLAHRQFKIREYTEKGCRDSLDILENAASKLTDREGKEIEVLSVSTNGNPIQSIGPFIVHLNRLKKVTPKRSTWDSLKSAVGSYVSGEIVNRGSVFTAKPAPHYFPR